MSSSAPKTLYDKIFDDHVVSRQPDGTCVLYIDRHLVHEVTSPQAFEGLRLSDLPVSPTRGIKPRGAPGTQCGARIRGAGALPPTPRRGQARRT